MNGFFLRNIDDLHSTCNIIFFIQIVQSVFGFSATILNLMTVSLSSIFFLFINILKNRIYIFLVESIRFRISIEISIFIGTSL